MKIFFRNFNKKIIFLCSFIVFLPEWKDPPLQCLSKLDESHFKRKQVVVMGMEHEYRHGYQYIIPKYVQIFPLFTQNFLNLHNFQV